MSGAIKSIIIAVLLTFVITISIVEFGNEKIRREQKEIRNDIIQRYIKINDNVIKRNDELAEQNAEILKINNQLHQKLYRLTEAAISLSRQIDITFSNPKTEETGD